ncbi:hypothetical protein ROZALSC1DRAFT_22081 [Rozella allomycis CSF55]|uniref:Uncharacterized protein n=1 Tax=Rozella allomycis (strain CSF55) TaxID=988480 RepID=A0A4P9YJU9_ROZAC|nr:hypothetical protein ROZALSC1DRAFT_22081 [Rozella allomycis CSF55]
MKTFFLFLALLQVLFSVPLTALKSSGREALKKVIYRPIVHQIHDEDHRNAIISELKALTTKGREVSNPLTPGSFTNSATYFFSTRLFDYVLEYLPRTKYYLSHNDNQVIGIREKAKNSNCVKIIQRYKSFDGKDIVVNVKSAYISDHLERILEKLYTAGMKNINLKIENEVSLWTIQKRPFNPQLLSAYVKPANLALSKLTGQEIDLFPEESDPFLKNIKIAAIN